MTEEENKVSDALKRLRARISSVSAMRSAALNYDTQDKRLWGYENATIARQDSLRGHIGALSEGLLEGVCVRSGDPRYEEYARVKTAELKMTYALYLLEHDLENYRNVFNENQKSQQVPRNQKYYQAPVPQLRIPYLWLDNPEFVTAQDSVQPPKEWHMDRLLVQVPDLWRSFYESRQREVEETTSKRRSATTKAGKAPEPGAKQSALPTAAAPASVSKAPAPPPGKTAPPPPGKTAPPPPGKTAPPPPGKTAPPPPGKAPLPTAVKKLGPPPKNPPPKG